MCYFKNLILAQNYNSYGVQPWGLFYFTSQVSFDGTNYCKPIFVGAYYRPHISNHVSIEQLESSLSQLTSSTPNSIVCLAGDNVSNIDWSNNINCQQYLLGVIEDYCMTQVVTEFTEGETFFLQIVLVLYLIPQPYLD